jgi:ABC-type sugar transport system ATPase subunit
MLRINNISKTLGRFCLSNISFHINKGEYFILLGPSGAGKSILLEIISGLISPDAGTIVLNEKDITKSSIQQRSIGLLFQDFAVFPHLTVRQNIAFPIKKKYSTTRERDRKVLELSEKFGISHLLKQKAAKLSGGEKQRVALARTLALEPEILLLDEPLSALDSEKRIEIRSLLRNLNRAGQTILHVTHDYEEAIALGHTVAVLSAGELEQVGSPEEVFNKPASSFVANLIGVRNFFEASLTHSADQNLMKANLKCGLIFYVYAENIGEGFISFADNAVNLSDSAPTSSALNNFKGTVVDIYPQRYGYDVIVNIKVKVVVNISHESLLRFKLFLGKEVWISIKAGGIQFIPFSLAH